MKKIIQLASLLFIVGTMSSQNLLQNLLACYPLNGNATNMASTGSALDGTIYGTATGTTDRFNQPSSALAFDSTNNMVELDDPSLKPANAISFSGWFKFSNTNPLVQYIVFTKNTCSGNFEAYSLALAHKDIAAANCYRFCFNKIGTNCIPSPIIIGTTNLSPNTWYHFGCYAGSDSMKLFLNGMPEGTPVPAPNAIVYDNNNLSVYLGGSNQSALPGRFKGSMDDVRFYDRKLTNYEFNALYSTNPACGDPMPGLLNGLQACYPLNCNVKNYAPTASVPPSLDGTAHNVQCDTGHTGALNTAYKFLGDTSSYIKLPNDTRIKPTGGLSFSAWSKIDVLNNYQYIVFAKNTCISYFEGYALLAEDAGNGMIRYLVEKTDNSCSPSGYAGLTSSALYSAYDWHHVVFYIDGGVVKLYVDANSTPDILNFTGGLHFDPTSVILGGTRETAFNRPLNGSIDNVRFYDRELTATEVSRIFDYDPSCETVHACGGNPSNCRPFISTGIEDRTDNGTEIEIFPNPSTGKLYISYVKDKSLTIYDINGKVVQHSMRQVDETISEINLTETAEGLYFVKIIDNKGNTVQTTKIIVRR